jgi:hypothetical protein
METQKNSPDNFNLSKNLTKSPNNLTQFIGQDGSEFVIDTTTGDSFISTSAASRVLETARTTVRHAQIRLKIETISAEIQTAKGLRSVAMVNATDFYKLAEEFKPELAKQSR